MVQRIALEFARGGRVRAVLLADRAPRTCAAVWNALPHEAEVLHARWAGREIFLPIPLPDKPPMENLTNRVSAGEIIYFREWEGQYDNTGFETVGLFYGAEVIREWRGDVKANLIARLLPEDLPLLEEVGLRVWRQGAEWVRVERDR
jgi:hypothetical protein